MPINETNVSNAASLILELIKNGQAAYVQIRVNEGLSTDEAWAECDRESSALHTFIAAEKARLAGTV